MTASGDDAPWWETAFADVYLELYAHRDDRAARAEVAGVLPRLRSAPGPVCDVCCGTGRHLEAMREAGLNAIGYDLSPQLLAEGRKRRTIRGRLARGDIRRPPLASGLGAITLFFTAFGYFDDSANRAALGALGACLAPRGWLLLDLPDPERLVEALAPHTERTTASGARIMEQRSVEEGDHELRVEKKVTAQLADGSWHRYTESVRLYQAPEIAVMAVDAGLEAVDRWRSLRGGGHDDGRHVYWLRKV